MGLSNLRKRPDRWSASVWRLLSGEKRLRHPHHIRTPDKYRRSLVQCLGLDIEDSLLAVGCQTAGLLENKGERIGLVHQAELAFGVALRGRINVDAAFDQVAMEVGDEGTDIPGGVRTRAHAIVPLQPLDIPLETHLPRVIIPLVD